jgi:hypothetical protein
MSDTEIADLLAWNRAHRRETAEAPAHCRERPKTRAEREAGGELEPALDEDGQPRF